MEGGGGSDYTKEGAHSCGEHHPSDTSWQSNMVYHAMATIHRLFLRTLSPELEQRSDSEAAELVLQNCNLMAKSSFPTLLSFATDKADQQ